MLTKKRKISAIILVWAMLLAGVTPITAYAEDEGVTGTQNYETLTVTADLIDDKGVVTLKNLNTDKIIIPNTLGAKKVVLKNVITAILVIETDTECEIEISGGFIEKLEVAASKVKELNLRDLAELIAGGMSKTKAEETYYNSKKAAKEKKKQMPTVTLNNNAVVTAIEVAGNANLFLKGGKADKLQMISENAENLKVTVDAFDGILIADQNNKAFAVMELELKNCGPVRTEISSNGKGSIIINGTESVLADAVIDGSSSVVLNIETTKLETAKNSRNANLVVSAPMEVLVINGEATDVDITSGMEVKKVVINGINATIDGKYTIGNIGVDCEHSRCGLQRVELEEGAKTCADGVIISMFCLECGAAFSKERTTEHYHSVVDIINLFEYGTECGGYIIKSGCACGKESDGVAYGLYNMDAWTRYNEKRQDEQGRWHSVLIFTYDNIRIELDFAEAFIEGRSHFDQTFSLYVDDKFVKALHAIYSMDSQTRN